MAISSIPDPYKALGLTPEATAAEIRSAYKKLMLKCHPDKVHDESQKEEKAQQYQKVMEAYELLSDPKKKRRYDLDMQRQAGAESRPTSATAAADPATKTESRDTSEEGRKEKSRERAQRHESSKPARRDFEQEEYHRQRDMPKEKEIPREKEVPREREMPTEREVPHERDVPKEREIPREMPSRESDMHRDREVPREAEKPREKESSRDRERIHKEHKEYKEYKEYKEARDSKDHSHSRESSKEKERKHSIRPETSPPPASDAYKLHQRNYEEMKRAEQEKLQRVRNVRMYGDPDGMAAPLGGGSHTGRGDSQERLRRREEERHEREQRERSEREKMESARLRYEYEMQQKLRKNKDSRDHGRAQDSEELDGFNMDDVHPKGTESRRGSAQNREPSPKDSPASSRERKSSHSPSHRKESVSPVRGESLHSSGRPIPIRTPYGSAPPPAAGSTFAPFSSSASPRRRHSVSSQDPMKAARLYPREDSGYSSPNHPGTPMGPDGKIPPLMRSSTESGERSSGWKEYAFKVYIPDDPDMAIAAEAHAAAVAAAAGGYAYAMPMPGHLPRRKTTSHHPLDTANLTSSPPLHSGEFRKGGPIPSSSSGSTAYHYPSPTSAYYPSPTHASHHFSHSSGASSVHPQQSPSRGHSSRHTSSSSHHHSTSPHGSPKVPQDGFVSMNGVRSPNMSSASTVHPAAGYHYGRNEYFAAPPVLPRGHTL